MRHAPSCEMRVTYFEVLLSKQANEHRATKAGSASTLDALLQA